MARDHRHLARTLDGSKRIRLDDVDTSETGGLDKEQAVVRLEKLGRELSELENLLAYAGTHSLLVVLQGRDASGKDGSARKILEFTNIQSAYVKPFKVPTEEERAHDFLWRVHAAVPRRGYMAIFNRSHYEDVLAARVHRLVPEPIWKRRYADINAFERLLVDSNVILLKFYLHLSADEQYDRLLAREKDPRTAWKLNPNEDALDKCATRETPWYLVPADRKWFRNLAIFERLVLALRPYRGVWLDSLKKMGKSAMKEIRALRAQAKRR